MTEENVASTPNVPLPGIRTAVYSSGEAHKETNLRRTSRMISMNSVSRDPRSRSIACLTVWLVVNGPGVKRALSFHKDSLKLDQPAGVHRKSDLILVAHGGDGQFALIKDIHRNGMPLDIQTDADDGAQIGNAINLAV